MVHCGLPATSMHVNYCRFLGYCLVLGKYLIEHKPHFLWPPGRMCVILGAAESLGLQPPEGSRGSCSILGSPLGPLAIVLEVADPMYRVTAAVAAAVATATGKDSL